MSDEWSCPYCGDNVAEDEKETHVLEECEYRIPLQTE